MVDYNGYQDIIIEKNDGIALLTMNRPEVFNATGFTLHNELSRVWLDLGPGPRGPRGRNHRRGQRLLRRRRLSR